MGKSDLRWLYSQGNKATGNWLMKPPGSEVAWDQREGKRSRGDKKQGETTANLKEPHFFLMELLMLVNCKQSSY